MSGHSVSCLHCEKPFIRSIAPQKYCSALCRFLSKVNVTESCWEWTAARSDKGYGRFAFGVKTVLAHRWSFEHIGGQALLPGLTIDHLCRNRACVNPSHLEQVTQRENVMRGLSPGVVTHLTGICKRGHSMDDALTLTNGRPTCRTCFYDGARKRRRARAEAKMEPVE